MSDINCNIAPEYIWPSTWIASATLQGGRALGTNLGNALL